MDDIPDLDAVVVSVGGGGLISGIAAAVKEVNKNCKVYGVEPEGANSMSQSLLKGQPVTLEKVDTVADSLSPPMSLPMGLAICQKYFMLITSREVLFHRILRRLMWFDGFSI